MNFEQVVEFFDQSPVLESNIHQYVGIAEATAMKKGVAENTAAASTAFHFTTLFNEFNRIWIMNRRDTQQLKPSIAGDLVQGQGGRRQDLDHLGAYRCGNTSFGEYNGRVDSVHPDRKSKCEGHG